MRGTLTPRIEHNQGPGSHKRSGALSRPQPIPKPAPKSMHTPQHLALSSPCITRTVPVPLLLVGRVGVAVVVWRLAVPFAYRVRGDQGHAGVTCE